MLSVTSPTAVQHIAALHAHHSCYHTNSGKKCVRIPWGRHLISGRNGTNRTSVLASNISGHRRCCPRAIRLDGTACDARHTVGPCESPSLCLSNISLCPPDQTIRHTQLKCLPGKCVALISNTEQGKTAQRNPSCSFQHPEIFT